ncbi:TetR/AcrR family transcriptional regulator [Streptomyces sp. PSKA30]|uniref:TetR/AcrR family transcriptional regulator n=1 Tax=Streptomyces sp. PSKA30 TaxID=2874597 RepID=UPI001CD1003C|nr:TetR/AcrR family transcriptional regulator [Streptomyces sp. PSKA30]MBZ9638698.1 TetR/AcrR family transcriptional regulator [Streptomyces sp. PSKA30]
MAIAKKAWNTREKLDREDSATRAQLLRAARSVFEQRGYARTAIADITAAAEVSRATFYVYFASKEAVFGVLAGEVRDRFLAAQELDGLDAEDPYAVAEATIAAYLDAYVENLAFLTVLEHQAITDPAMYALWEEIHTRPRGRGARYIVHLTQRAMADPVAPPEAVATAAGGMVAAFAPGVAKEPSTRAEVVAHLTAMYLRLLGVPLRSPAV